MITKIVPNSVFSGNTDSLDKTWADRLSKIRVEELLVDIEYESNPVKVEMWLEMFGIDISFFDFGSMTSAQRRTFILHWIFILTHSGCEDAIIKMAQLLGANSATISYGHSLTYNGAARYDGLYIYDGGQSYSRFSINVNIWGIVAPDRASYEFKFRKLMNIAQPIRIHLKSLTFY